MTLTSVPQCMSGQGPACRTPPWWQSSPKHEQDTQNTIAQVIHLHPPENAYVTSHCFRWEWDVLCSFKQARALPQCILASTHLAAVVASLEPVANEDLSLGVRLLLGGDRVPAKQDAAGAWSPPRRRFLLSTTLHCMLYLPELLCCIHHHHNPRAGLYHHSTHQSPTSAEPPTLKPTPATGTPTPHHTTGTPTPRALSPHQHTHSSAVSNQLTPVS